MSVRFSKDVEKELMENRVLPRKTWEFYRSHSIVEALHKARDMGWAENKVQVKAEPVREDLVEYVIEPYESNCKCPSLLSYDDYFLRPDEIESKII